MAAVRAAPGPAAIGQGAGREGGSLKIRLIGEQAARVGGWGCARFFFEVIENSSNGWPVVVVCRNVRGGAFASSPEI